MIRGPDTTRRGAALILALVTMMIVLGAAATMAGLASRVTMSRQLHTMNLMADELLEAAEQPIVHWLTSEASAVTLPPETPVPEVHVLHHQWVHEGVEFEIRICAWDQHGMPMLDAVRAGSPLRLALPEDVLAAVDEQDPTLKMSRLDQLADPLEAAAVSPFPVPASSHPVVLNDAAGNEATGAGSFASGGPTALGAHLATHGSHINVNTAPLALIEQAMRLAGRGGFEHVVAARSAGKQANAGSLHSNAQPAAGAPVLVSSSDSWSFRIDVRVGVVHKSHWAIYQPAVNGESSTRSASGETNSPWEAVQTIVIRH